MNALSNRVVNAWLPLQASDGEMRLKSPGLHRPARNTAYFGAAVLSMAGRTTDETQRRRLARRGVLAVDHAVAVARRGSPFTVLAVAIAYRNARRELDDYDFVRSAMRGWGDWLNAQKASDAPAEHDCFKNPDCYNNWDLVRALSVIEALKARPEGTAEPGSFLADRQATRDWLRGVLNVDIPKAIGPQPKTDWGLGRAGVLSDPPSNPPAYHQFSAALLSEARAEAPGLFDGNGLDAATRASHYSKALVAPNGDVAMTGRSQLQSWTLAAVLLVAAHGVGGKYDATWRAVGDRVLTWLESFVYRDRTGVFAITPSARTQSLSGIDGYAAPADYNGLTLMLLDLAARAWEPGGDSGSVPTDRNGSFADLHGSHLVIARKDDVWWQWQTRRKRQDMRFDQGLIQVQTKINGKWTPLLAARPNSKADLQAGPALAVNGVYAPFTVTKTEPVPNGVQLIGQFVPRGASVGVPSTITVNATGEGVEISWPVKAGQRFAGALPMVGARNLNGKLVNSRTRVSFSPKAVLAAGGRAPSASSVATRLQRWSITAKDDGVATLRVEARASNSGQR